MSIQFNLALESKWLTKNFYFHLSSTYIGINAVNIFHLASWHGIINYSKKDDKKMSICTLAGILSHQLIKSFGSHKRVTALMIDHVKALCALG